MPHSLGAYSGCYALMSHNLIMRPLSCRWCLFFFIVVFFSIQSENNLAITFLIPFIVVRLAVIFSRVGCRRSLWPDGKVLDFSWVNCLLVFCLQYSPKLKLRWNLSLQCSPFPCGGYIFYYVVVYPVCWRLLQSIIWETWHWHFWWVRTPLYWTSCIFKLWGAC